MAANGFRSPIVLSKRSGFIVKGHGRLQAAILGGWKQVPVDIQEYENEAAEVADLEADNRIALLAEIDDELSKVNAMFLLDNNYDLDFGGFDFDFIKDLDKQEGEKKGKTDEDEIPEVKESICKAGDLWQLGEHRLLCGDSTNAANVEKLMDGNKADMVFTDPPYGDDHASMELVPKNERKVSHDIIKKRNKILNDSNIDFLKDVCSAINPFLNVGFSAFVFFKWSKWEKIKEYFSDFGSPKTVCVWDRDSQGASTFRINPVHEFCFYWGTLSDKKETGNLRNVWRCRKELENKVLHPTVKPIEIIEMPIRMCCEKKRIVLDVFLGSGSTLIACEKTNRKCYGMELDPHYCDVIIKRWEDFTGNKAKLMSNING
jgi:DNA modification methylase